MEVKELIEAAKAFSDEFKAAQNKNSKKIEELRIEIQELIDKDMWKDIEGSAFFWGHKDGPFNVFLDQMRHTDNININKLVSQYDRGIIFNVELLEFVEKELQKSNN